MSARSAAPPRHRRCWHHARRSCPRFRNRLPARRRWCSFGLFPDVFLDDVEDRQSLPSRRLGSARDDCVIERAVEWKGAPREIRTVEWLLPETLKGLAHLLEELGEQRNVGGVIDSEMELEIL